MRDRDEEALPETESRGDLDPPRRPPRTAVGAGVPDGEEPARRPAELDDPARTGIRAHRRRALPVRAVAFVLAEMRGVVRRQLARIRG
jgi:hypothetical protein